MSMLTRSLSPIVVCVWSFTILYSGIHTCYLFVYLPTLTGEPDYEEPDLHRDRKKKGRHTKHDSISPEDRRHDDRDRDRDQKRHRRDRSPSPEQKKQRSKAKVSGGKDKRARSRSRGR